MEPSDKGKEIGFWQHNLMAIECAFSEFGIVRDMVIGTTIAAITLAIQVQKHLIPLADWREHKKWWVLSFILPYLLVLGCHAVWRLLKGPWLLYLKSQREHDKALQITKDSAASAKVEVASLKDKLEKKTRDWAGDWKELVAQFREIVRYSVSANWSRTSAGEQWNLAGDNDVIRRISSLCKHAGDLLLASPKVSKTISAELALYPASDRWLYYLKSSTRAFRLDGYGVEPLGSGEKFINQLGSIPNLAEVSGNACMECAGQEY